MPNVIIKMMHFYHKEKSKNAEKYKEESNNSHKTTFPKRKTIQYWHLVSIILNCHQQKFL